MNLTVKPEQLPREQFTALFTDAYGKLWSLAHALTGNRSEADDLVQEAALIGIQKYSQFSQGTNFTAWMGKIVRYQAKNHIAKLARRRTSSFDPIDMDQTENTRSEEKKPTIKESAAGDLTNLHEALDDHVSRAVQTLELVPRACLLLRVLHELTYDEIGEILDIPSGTAMSHVHRSRVKIRKQISLTNQESSQA